MEDAHGEASLGSRNVGEWQQLEVKYVDVGKSYGLSGKELQDFVVSRLAKAEEREQRFLEREDRELQRQADMDAAKLEAQRDKQRYEVQLSEAKGHKLEVEERRPALKLEVPKFDSKTDIATYFELFENIVRENGVAQKNWHLHLRNAAAGTKLATIIDDFSESFDVLKREALLAFGSTASSSWKELLSCRQGAETFRQFNTLIRLLRPVLPIKQPMAMT